MGGSTPTPPPPPPPPQPCPERLEATLTGPAEGIQANTWLDVRVDQIDGAPQVRTVDPIDGRVVGSIQGIPQLRVLVRCIEQRGEEYRAFVEAVDGGRVDVVLMLQG